MAKYNFSKVYINRDFGLGVGSSLKLNFQIIKYEEEEKNDKDDDDDEVKERVIADIIEFSALAIPMFD